MIGWIKWPTGNCARNWNLTIHINGICTTQHQSWIMTHTQIPLGFWHTKTDHLMSTRQPDLIIINKRKRTCKIVDFAVPAHHRVKLIESKNKDKYLDLTRELKKTVEHEGDNYTNYNWCCWYSYQRINIGTGGLRNKRTSGDHPN